MNLQESSDAWTPLRRCLFPRPMFIFSTCYFVKKSIGPFRLSEVLFNCCKQIYLKECCCYWTMIESSRNQRSDREHHYLYLKPVLIYIFIYASTIDHDLCLEIVTNHLYTVIVNFKEHWQLQFTTKIYEVHIAVIDRTIRNSLGLIIASSTMLRLATFFFIAQSKKTISKAWFLESYLFSACLSVICQTIFIYICENFNFRNLANCERFYQTATVFQLIRILSSRKLNIVTVCLSVSI